MGSRSLIERDAADPVLGPVAFRVDARMEGTAAVDILRALTRELEDGPLAETLLFVWESLTIRRASATHEVSSWWSTRNQFAVERRQIAMNAALDLRKAAAWVTSRPGWMDQAFLVYVALRDDELEEVL